MRQKRVIKKEVFRTPAVVEQDGSVSPGFISKVVETAIEPFAFELSEKDTAALITHLSDSVLLDAYEASERMVTQLTSALENSNALAESQVSIISALAQNILEMETAFGAVDELLIQSAAIAEMPPGAKLKTALEVFRGLRPTAQLMAALENFRPKEQVAQ